jgi:molecular chaperone Hsp33
MNDTLDRDTLIRFVLEHSGIRGVLVRLDRTWTDLRGESAYPDAVAQRLGEVCAASALFTGHIKTQGRLSVQMRGTGALRTLFAECTAAGTLRGIAQWEPPLPAVLTPRDFGGGSVLAITIEHPRPGQQDPIRYQGLIGLGTTTLAQAFEDYFERSEQLPSRILLSANDTCAAGLMLQRLPGSELDPDGWDRACALFATLTPEELRSTPVLTLLYRLFHEDGVRVLGSQALGFACSCSRERVGAVLVSLGQEEALAAAADTGIAEITCEFCNRRYTFDRVDLGLLFAAHPSTAPARPQ